MPLPTPGKDESQSDFLSRCMGNEVMNREFPDQKQRAAVCHSQHRKARKDAIAEIVKKLTDPVE